MNIDDKTLSKYKNNQSAFSHTLKSGINFKKSKFKWNKNKRCAFLNDKGFCEIIINLGEENLCQVCRDHPRFRSFFNDKTETGLGFCCEEATRIILTFKDKIAPTLVSDDANILDLDFNQKNVLNFREKAIEILQNRETDINERINRLLKTCNANFIDSDFKKILKTFLRFERIDKGWTKTLKSLPTDFDRPTDQELAHYCEQFLVNSLYRHLSDAEDTVWVRARTLACVFSWWIIKSVIYTKRKENTNLLELVISVTRDFSAEVEYSMKNLNKLFDFCYKFIQI